MNKEHKLTQKELHDLKYNAEKSLPKSIRDELLKKREKQVLEVMKKKHAKEKKPWQVT